MLPGSGGSVRRMQPASSGSSHRPEPAVTLGAASDGDHMDGERLDGERIVFAFGRYLERTLAENRAGTAEVLWGPFALPSPRAAVAVCVGRRPGWWLRLAAARSGLHVAFSGTAGRGRPGDVRRVPLTVLDRWDPRSVGPTPAEFDVLAIATTYNEADVVEDLIARLRADAIRVHLIDNWSTDATFDLATRRAAQDPGVVVERFPAEGPTPYFELERLLTRVEDVAHASGADWVVNHDADEVRESPWDGVSLRRGLYCVEHFGFTCVDHTVMNFRPVDESWEDHLADAGGTRAAGRRLVEGFRWFEFGVHPAIFRQQRAWTPQPPPVRIAAAGGHDATFPGRRVFPYRFILRHYPIRSSTHGRRKVLRERQGRWSPEERAKGWHVHYDEYGESSEFVWDPSGLHRFTTLADLDQRLLVERLSGAGLPHNPFPGESGADDPGAPPPR